MKKIIKALVVMLAPANAFALSENTIPASPSMLILQTLFGLLLVVGCIFLLAWLAKRLNLTQMGQNNSFGVVASLALSAREKAVLIQAGDQQILLGVAPGNVRQLHVFEAPIIAQESPEKSKAKLSASTATEFSKKLNEFLSQGNKTQ